MLACYAYLEENHFFQIVEGLCCSAQCWSFMQCCFGNFLMHSWHELRSVDAVIKTVNLTNDVAVKLNQF